LHYSLAQRVAARLVGGLGQAFFGFALRHARHDWRFHLEGPLDDALRAGRQVIVTAWHQDVMLLFHYLITYTGLEQRQRFAMLASRSFDGEVTERLLAPWGFRFVRGSAGKKGARAALLGLTRAAQAGASLVVIGDGPQPPPYEMKPGPIFLARRTGLPLFVVRAWARPQLVVPSTWFRLAIPLPRAHCAVHSAEVDVSGDFEEARQRAESALNRACETADAQIYLTPRPRGGVRLATRGV
jgi:lysophospholipid acyltransferase (LPLAT)-like uncharacterized protein